MPNYHTSANGIQGTGSPIVPLGSQSADAPVNSSELTGGTFSGMRVSANVKSQIETGNAGDFFYFTPAQEAPGQFDMHAKIPEFGCQGPGKPVFKLRENNNRLMKGVAQKFLNADGQLDMQQGMKFVKEYRRRFGLEFDGDAFSPEKPLDMDRVTLHESAIDWLAQEIGVPVGEKEDFRNYCRATLDFMEDQKALGDTNFLKLWENYCINNQTLDDMMKDGNSLASTLQPGGAGEGPYQRNITKRSEATEELNRIASIDPASEMSMIVPTECSGSTRSNRYYRELSNRARNALGKETVQSGPVRFTVSIEGHQVEISKRPDDLFAQLQKLDEKMADAATLEEQTALQKQRNELSEEYRKALEAKEQLDARSENSERKWNFHEAPVVGSYVGDDGKTYYLTAEAFAPESNVLAEHPAVTDKVSIGVYTSQEDFEKYYLKDDPFVKKEGEMKDFLDERREKDPGALQTISEIQPEISATYAEMDRIRQQYRQEYQEMKKVIQSDVRDGYAGSVWQEKYDKRHEGKSYKPLAGSRAGKLCSDYMIETSELVRQAHSMREGVPEEHRAQYDAFLTKMDQLVEQNGAFGEPFMVHRLMQSFKSRQLMSLELLRDDQYSAEPSPYPNNKLNIRIHDLEKEKEMYPGHKEELEKELACLKAVQEYRAKGEPVPEELKYPAEELNERIERLNRELDTIDRVIQSAGQRESQPEWDMRVLTTPLKRMMEGKGFDVDQNFEDPQQAVKFRDFLRSNGLNETDFVKFVNDVSKGMQPPRAVELDVQSVFPDVAAGFLKKTGQSKDVFGLSDLEREFATQNIDTALSAAFPKQVQDGMKQRGEDVFDHVYINGVSANEVFAGRYDYMEPGRAQELKKSEVMRHLLNGEQIDFSRQNESGQRETVPLTFVSSDPSVNAIASKIRSSGEPRADYGPNIAEHERELASSGRVNRADVEFTMSGEIKQDLFDMIQSTRGPVADQQYKAAAGLAIMNQLTGANIASGQEPDLHLMGAALNRIYINGVPYASSLPEGITKENRQAVLSDLADRVASSMGEQQGPDGNYTSPSANHISVLKDGKLEPLTYTPPEPVPPRKARMFASRAEKQRIEQERQQYMADMKRKEHWAERNHNAQERCGVYDSLREQTFKPSSSAPRTLAPAAGAVKEVEFSQMMARYQRDQQQRRKALTEQIHRVRETEQKKAQKGHTAAQTMR